MHLFKAHRRLAAISSTLLFAYLGFWPVPIEPVAWISPQGSVDFSALRNGNELDQAQHLVLGPASNPESVAIDSKGRIYTGLMDARIMRFNTPSSPVDEFVQLPPGRPLGLAFDAQDNLFVAHVPLGLFKVKPDGHFELVLSTVDGTPLRYADDLDIARDGTIYISDATTKFDPTHFGGPYSTSRIDLLEHGGHGRLIEYNPHKDEARVVLSNLQFANGIALTHDETAVLISETGTYQILRWHRSTPKAFPEVVAGPFPGFPDNIKRGQNGRYWVGIVSDRSASLDALSEWPFLRKVAYRLPVFLQPRAQSTGLILGLDESFKVRRVLSGSAPRTGFTVGAVQSDSDLFISRLKGDSLLRVKDLSD